MDGRVYVNGGYVTDLWTRSECWAEVLDQSTGHWETVASLVEVRRKWMHASAVIGGRVYALVDRGEVVYDLKTRIRGFNAKNRVWKELKGVEKKLPKFLCGTTMVNVGETGLSV
ncbi:hypothetical protein ACLB2K_040653 [Fragaria x ananassa]